MTDSFSTLASTVPNPNETYLNWQPTGSGPDGLSYVATRQSDGVAVELRVIQPIVADDSLVDQLRHRAGLIDLCATAQIRRLVEFRLSGPLPWVVMERPRMDREGDRLLGKLLEDDREADRLRVRLSIARELVAALRVAHRVGLQHGHLAAETIIVGREGHIRVDFSLLNVAGDGHASIVPWTFATATRGEPFDDLIALRLLLRRLLGNDTAALTSLSARSRAALRSLLRADQDEEASVPTLAQWETVLGSVRLLPVPDDPNGTMETAPPANRGQAVTESFRQDATEERRSASQSHGDLTGSRNTQGDAARGHQMQGDQALDDQTRVCENGSDETGGTSETMELLEGVVGGASLAAGPLLEPGSVLGRYRLEKKLGQGGMGIVFRGVDLADNSSVAIKILWASGMHSPQSIRRFHKEARLLAGVQNDYVTRLYEVGEDSGLHFIAMEFVEGTTLKHWLAESGPLNERTALMVTADIARALVDAHAQGIIHRDIKPDNVLLQDNGQTSPDQLNKRVKLSDFGIARHIDQSASLEVTQAGSLLGTPRYMSPEQFRGTKTIGAQTDVYSLGITLYELLTGQPPFDAEDALALAAMHCFEPVPVIQRKVPTLSDLTAHLVSRALAKDPEDRFADASQMLASIQRILCGEVADFDLHPKLPAHDPAKLWQKTFSWHLKSSASELWPFVSNTERLNRALGLPPVSYRTVEDPQRGLRKFGSFRLGTVSVSWEEHPFEWIEGSRMGVLREFDSGPFKWFMSIVELKPHPAGGTLLEHQIRIEPRNLLGRVLTTLEADWRGGKNLHRVYTRVDRSIQQKLEPAAGEDAFEPAVQPNKRHQQRLDQRYERLVDHGVDPDLARKLTQFIATAPQQVVAQIRPLTLAQRFGVDGDRCVEACLRAASEGLLMLRWEILCPTCRVSASAESLLSSIKEHTHCAACNYDFRSDLGEAIELVFRVHPEIRAVDDAVYCIGGPAHSPHVVAQLRLEPGERVDLEVRLAAGDYLIRGPRLVGQQQIRVRQSPAPSTWEISLSQLGLSDHTPILRAGQQTLTLANDHDQVQVMRVERMIARADVVTATHASTFALFRELFPDQVMNQHRPIEADEMTLIATGIHGVDALYAAMGDREAYDLIGRHLDILRTCVTSHRGTVAKTVGEGILAAFVDCDHAVDAALAMQAAIDAEPGLGVIRLSIGVHRGRTLVANMNQRLDYFGGTARAVGTLPEYAAGDVLLTESVFADPQVQNRLRRQGLAGAVEPLQLAGKSGQVVQRVAIPRSGLREV